MFYLLHRSDFMKLIKIVNMLYISMNDKINLSI